MENDSRKKVIDKMLDAAPKERLSQLAISQPQLFPVAKRFEITLWHAPPLLNLLLSG